MHDINKWIFEIPLSDIQEDSSGETGCICCGKKIANPKFFVHLLANGNLVSSEEDFANSQGFFPIGSGCKDKLPNNFWFKNQSM